MNSIFLSSQFAEQKPYFHPINTQLHCISLIKSVTKTPAHHLTAWPNTWPNITGCALCLFNIEIKLNISDNIKLSAMIIETFDGSFDERLSNWFEQTTTFDGIECRFCRLRWLATDDFAQNSSLELKSSARISIFVWTNDKPQLSRTQYVRLRFIWCENMAVRWDPSQVFCWKVCNRYSYCAQYSINVIQAINMWNYRTTQHRLDQWSKRNANTTAFVLWYGWDSHRFGLSFVRCAHFSFFSTFLIVCSERSSFNGTTFVSWLIWMNKWLHI